MLIKRGLRNVLGEVRPDFFAPPVSRPPKVRGGFPFMVEVGLVYGGALPADQPVQILRFANRVPLLFQQGACAITNAIEQPRLAALRPRAEGRARAFPRDPRLLLVHVALHQDPVHERGEGGDRRGPRDRPGADARAPGRRPALADPPLAPEPTRLREREVRDHPEDPPEARREDEPPRRQAGPRPDPRHHPHHGRREPRSAGDERQGRGPGPGRDHELHAAGPGPRAVPRDPAGARWRWPRSRRAPTGPRRNSGRAWWTLPKLAPNGRTQLEITFPAKTDVEANDLDWYVAGIDEAHLLGADPLPGDWDVRLPRTIVEAAEAAAAEAPAPTERAKRRWITMPRKSSAQRQRRRVTEDEPESPGRRPRSRPSTSPTHDLRPARPGRDPPDAPAAPDEAEPRVPDARGGLEARPPAGDAQRAQARRCADAPADVLPSRLHQRDGPRQEDVHAPGALLHQRGMGGGQVPQRGRVEPPDRGPRGACASASGRTSASTPRRTGPPSSATSRSASGTARGS